MASTTNETLKAELKALIEDRDQRPFVCKGSPVSCRIFIVGFNPATKMRQNFWDFWPGDEFDWIKWRKAYEIESKKQRSGRQSQTRKNLDRITDGLPSGECLETNLYWTPTSGDDGLEPQIRARSVTARPFFHLLRAVSPRIVVAHGRQVLAQRDAIEFIVPGVKFIPAERHLSRISDQKIGELIDRIQGTRGAL